MKRIEFVDFAKGIGILLIVMCHVGIKQEHIYIFYAAQVPLFFVLSGLFFEKSYAKANFVKKKFNTLLAPFVIYYFLSYAIYYILSIVFGPLNPMVVNYTGLQDIFTQRLLFNGPLWFLLCLFEVELLYYLLFKYIKCDWIRLVICILAFLLGYSLGYKQVLTPLKIDAALVAMPFFYLGIWLSKQSWFISKMKWYISVGLSIAFFLLYILFPCKIDMNAGLYSGAMFLLWIGCVGLVMCILFASKAFNRNYAVNWMGVNSLTIMCTHHLVYRPAKLFLMQMGWEYPLCILLFTLLIEIPVVIFVSKYCTALIGKFDWFTLFENGTK